MTRAANMLRVLPAALALLVLAGCGQGGSTAGAPSPGTGLTGDTRAQFVKGSVMSCTQKGAIEMANVPQATILAYCECSSNALADRLSEADIATINADPTKARQTMAPIIQAAALACRSTLGR